MSEQEKISISGVPETMLQTTRWQREWQCLYLFIVC